MGRSGSHEHFIDEEQERGTTTSLQTFHEIGPSETPNEKANMYTMSTDVTPESVMLDSASFSGGGRARTKYALHLISYLQERKGGEVKDEPKTSIETPQIVEPILSQNRFPLILTNTNMNVMAETNLTIPKTPVRKRDEESVVKPAEINITGASICSSALFLASGYAEKRGGPNNNSKHSIPPYSARSSTPHQLQVYASYPFS